MPFDRPSELLASRLSRLVDGLLDENEAAELEETLRRTPAARDYYRCYLAIHLDMGEHFEQDAIGRPVATPIRPRRTSALLAMAAMIPFAAGLGIWWMVSRSNPVPDPLPPLVVAPAPAPSPDPVLAVTARTEEVRWSLPAPPAPGLKLCSGLIRLESGRLALDLVGGQTVTLVAPAEFELLTETEMSLTSGNAALRVVQGGPAYIVRTPGGAVVDLGTELSVEIKVAPGGSSDVHVFEGMAKASIMGAGGRTREERLLRAGESVRIADTLETSLVESHDIPRPMLSGGSDSSLAGELYAAEITKSGPLAWWRFDHLNSQREVSDEAGSCPLRLHGNPELVGISGRRFLQTDASGAAGFAVPAVGLAGLDTERGLSIECLLYPTSERHMSAISFEQPDLPAPQSGEFAELRHAPSRLVIDRMARRGAVLGHVHPDFAIRSAIRSPAGYKGGVNMYSTESHLLHRWVHVVLTNDGSAIRLYIDGGLSDEAPVSLLFQSAVLRPIIARVQPEPEEEHRQWIGGIDEVALYGRVLAPEEVRAHFDALEH